MKNVGVDESIAVKTLLDGGVVAFPTETVMGLGVIYDNYEAYQKLNVIKGRPEDKPYTMMLGDIKDIEEYAYLTDRDKKIIKEFMPGPLTVLLKAKDTVPGYVTHNTGVIGIRVPDFKILLNLLKNVKKPLLVPSANPSGKAPAINVSQVLVYFGETLNYIYAYDALGAKPSTVLDLTGVSLKIVREGDLTLSNILNTVKETK